MFILVDWGKKIGPSARFWKALGKVNVNSDDFYFCLFKTLMLHIIWNNPKKIHQYFSYPHT